MKNYYLFVSILCTAVANAQSGKVGINTSAPTEILSVNGTVRVQELPLNGSTNSLYTKGDGTASSTKNQTFNPSKTVVADANGVLGVVSGLPTYGSSSNIVKAGNNWSSHQAISGDQCLQVSLYPFLVGLSNNTQFDVYVRLNPDSAKCSGKNSSYAAFQWVGGDNLGTQNNHWRGTISTSWTKIAQDYYSERSTLFSGSAVLWDIPQSYEWAFGSNNGANGSKPYDLYTSVQRIH